MNGPVFSCKQVLESPAPYPVGKESDQELASEDASEYRVYEEVSPTIPCTMTAVQGPASTKEELR